MQASPTLNNRYVKLSLLGGGEVRIAYTVMFGDAPATGVRRRVDTDGNGTLDANEIATFSKALAASVAGGLAVQVDGAPAKIAWEAPVPGVSDARVGPIPFSIDLVGRIATPGRGPHVVKLDDETPLDQLGETEIRIEEGPGTRVLAGWQGREDNGHVLRFLWNGPKFSMMEDRSIGFRFVDEKAHHARRPLPFAIAGVVLAAAVSILLVRRARGSRARAA